VEVCFDASLALKPRERDEVTMGLHGVGVGQGLHSSIVGASTLNLKSRLL